MKIPAILAATFLSAALAQTPAPATYARVDLIRAADGTPCLLELELTEPSLFFLHDEGAAERFVQVLCRRVGADGPASGKMAHSAA